MSDDFINDLVEIYARCETSEIKKDNSFIYLRDKHEENPIFQKQNQAAYEIKRRLEKRIQSQTSIKNQVCEALYLISQLIKSGDEDNIRFCYDLIRKIYCDSWGNSRWDYFDKSYQLLLDCHDYFLSFTSRNLTPHEINDPNRRYRRLISVILGRSRFKEAEEESSNLLAEAINHLLKSSGLKGFFYYDHEGDSQIVMEKLEKGYKKSLTFVQIIQKEIFLKPKNQENYCYYEFSHAKHEFSEYEAEIYLPMKERFFFVLAEKSYKNLADIWGEIPFDYIEWYEFVQSKDPFVLERPPTTQEIENHIEEIETNLIEKIRDVKRGIFRNVPQGNEN